MEIQNPMPTLPTGQAGGKQANIKIQIIVMKF